MSALARRLFDEAARTGGAARIASVLHPLTADFARYAAPQPTDCALDAGSGTGSLARLLAPRVCRIIALDVSAGELHLAHADVALPCVQGDIERPPFAPGTFTLVVAHFGLNLTDPRRSLPALRRIIAPGGRIAVQEWGPAADPIRAADEVLAAHTVESPGAPAADLRAAIETFPAAWEQQMQDVEDYREAFADAGFTVIDASESAPVTLRLSIDALIAFLLAETVRAAEMAALPHPARAACLDAMRARLRTWAGPGGVIAWSPPVIRLTARA